MEQPVLDYDDYVKKNRVAKLLRVITIVAAVVTAFVAMLLISTYVPRFGITFGSSTTLVDRIDWADQDRVPLHEGDSDMLATTIDRIVYAYDDMTMTTVEIPVDQRVVVVARYSFDLSDHRPGYVLANADTYSFAQTCVIERGGYLTLIGYDDGRALFGYTSPGYRTAPFDEKCVGVEMFFEKIT